MESRVPARAEDLGLRYCGLERGKRGPKIIQPSPGTAGTRREQQGRLAREQLLGATWFTLGMAAGEPRVTRGGS